MVKPWPWFVFNSGKQYWQLAKYGKQINLVSKTEK